MRLLSLSSCFQCRHTLIRASTESWTTLASLSFRRHRTTRHSKPKARPSSQKGSWKQANPEAFNRADEQFGPSYYVERVDPKNIPAFFEAKVKEWSLLQWLPQRLTSFGIPPSEISPLLKAFVRAVAAGELSTPEGHRKYVLDRFVRHLDDKNRLHSIDVIYNTILFTWASELEQVERLTSAGLSESTIHRIQSLAQAGDRWFPAEDYPEARKFHRKIIMHVGPTNSGKTHNALRALAAANTGVYAGPLRLLAHEIWDRLNRGMIVPAGVEETEEAKSADTDSTHDQGNPKYARPCNMRTGEELRVVDDSAPLQSCTVEMLSLRKIYDVAVIDEIQMIGDPERGSSWTVALLGICAKEVHLCGEETAVPVVQALLKDTGDEIIVNRYERLSPLILQEDSLNGDWSKVQKGDCIVTFSRSNIFSLKRKIEQLTPFRCALVYGRLPPEIRSEQAELFNDPNSGYDILIGSDAIGMGLNLKIRRIIFEDTKKYQGVREEPLSISQTKQIAGRAGRYGLHGNDPPGGYVTSLLPQNIAHIRKAMNALPQPLQAARIGIDASSYQAFSLALPPNSSTKTILEAAYYVSRIPVYLRQEDMDQKKLDRVCKIMETHLSRLSASDNMLLLLSPTPVLDQEALDIVSKFFKEYQETMSVDLWKCVNDSPLKECLEAVERLKAEENPKGVTPLMMRQLESLHKATVLYVWASFRRPMSWNCHEEVAQLKERLERALDWALHAITKSKPGVDWEQYLEENRQKKSKLVYNNYFLHSKR